MLALRLCRRSQLSAHRDRSNLHPAHTQVTDDFLQFSRARGNNLMSPVPMANFPGLKDGERCNTLMALGLGQG